MLLVALDRCLGTEMARWVTDALVGGVGARCGGVAVATSLDDEALISAAPGTVLVLDEDAGDEGLRAGAAAATAVVWVTASVAEGMRGRLGLDSGAGWKVPVAMVLVSYDRIDTEAVRARAGMQVVKSVAAAPTGGARRKLRSLGRRLGDAAAASHRFDAADGEVRRGTAKEAAARVVRELMGETGVEEFQIWGGELMQVSHEDGTVTRRASPFGSEEELIAAARFMASYAAERSQRFDRLSPRLDVMVGDWRVHAEAWVANPAIMVLRSNLAEAPSLGDLGVADEDLCALLIEAMSGQVRANCVLAAPMSGGKTTLAQRMLATVDAHERIDTIEDTPELRLAAKGFHKLTCERLTADPNAEGRGQLTMSDHVRDAKRCNTSKLVVGEIRGEGTGALLDAMSLGLSGCLVTLHSQPGRGVLEKLVEYARSEGAEPLEARRQIAGAVHLLVWLGRNDEGKRVIADVSQLEGIDESTGAIQTRCLWALRPGDCWASPVSPPTGYVANMYRSAGIHGPVETQEPELLPPTELRIVDDFEDPDTLGDDESSPDTVAR